LYFSTINSLLKKYRRFMNIAWSPFSTNLSNARSYFKVTIVLETINEDQLKKFEEKNSRIRDSIIKILISKRPDELLNSEGLQKLRNEIAQAVNKIMGTNEVTNVYFIDYIIQ
jgi:flagellar FliL protein